MTFKRVQAFIREVINKLFCPSCGEAMTPDAVGVRRITRRGAVLRADCSHCGNQFQAKAHITNEPARPGKVRHTAKRAITPEAVYFIGEALDAFNRGHIRDIIEP